MNDLLDALGAAKEGSRELDGQIALATMPFLSECAPDQERGPGHWLHPKHGPTHCPRYTTSLDDALTLVPEGWIWNVASSGCAWVMPPGDLDGQLVIGGIESPAIALCIAALKARAAVRARAAHDSTEDTDAT